MKRYISLMIGLSCSFWSLSAQAANASLFFSPDTVEAIQTQVDENPKAFAAKPKHVMHLDSIVFFSPKRWVLWLSGEKWTPQTTARDDLEILDVQETFVRLRLLVDGEATPREIHLRPLQSVNLLTGEVSSAL